MTKDTYGNLTLKGIEAYLKEKGFFPMDADVTVLDLHAVKESIEGFVNLIYHAYDTTGKSVILKQMLSFPRFSIEDEKNNRKVNPKTFDLGRMRSEITTLIFWNSIHPKICPEIYLFDEENRIIVMEELMDLSLLRFDLCRMKKNYLFAEKIGNFFGHNLFYSSNLHLTHYKKSEIERFFTNPEYTALSGFIFEENLIASWQRNAIEGTSEIRKACIENPLLQAEMKRLQTNFLENKECLIHTDLHSSNIMVNANDVRIIDGEFSGFGPIAQDFGRLTGSLVLNYISWFGNTEETSQEKERFQAYLCEAIETLYHHFQDSFRALVTQYKDSSYSLKTLDVDTYLINQLQESLSYTGANLTSRLSIQGICYDIGHLPEENQLKPVLMSIDVATEIMLNRKNYTKIEDFTALLKNLSK